MGCKRRTGQDWRPDRAITPEVMKSLTTKIEDYLSRGNLDESFRKRLVMAGAYFAIYHLVCQFVKGSGRSVSQLGRSSKEPHKRLGQTVCHCGSSGPGEGGTR